ncbi:CBS domain-containing protein [Natronococcus wangiae]|uniref:CBS domain-containing protein n=1 Tax=Natronococcus wangiae TaxID=3068275 RepID=UPI00273D188E|nr:CBS domain-containing protein [Natronococcus sp. AD5]
MATIEPSRPLDEAVETMLDRGASSLIATADGRADGIVTKTDVLESLTWTDRARSPVQVFGANLLDDITYDEVSNMIDAVARKYGDITVLEAKIHLKRTAGYRSSSLESACTPTKGILWLRTRDSAPTMCYISRGTPSNARC